MQIGIITVDGRQVGVVSLSTDGEISDTFTPDLAGYEPLGRASEHPPGEGPAAPRHRLTHHGNSAHLSDRAHHHTSRGGYTPKGEIHHGGEGRPVHQGSAEVDQAIVEAARAHHLDPNTMRSIASIESSMNPASNANRSTQYKGLFQIGRSEWARFGAGGNIYNAHDNAMAAARMFEANRSQFRSRYGRDPTDTELYMMHQQGLGFYTRGAMTNIGGNPYPGMRGAQSHESFEAGWGREVARRKAAFSARNPQSAAVDQHTINTDAPPTFQASMPLGRGKAPNVTGREYYGPGGSVKSNPWPWMRQSENVEDRRGSTEETPPETTHEFVKRAIEEEKYFNEHRAAPHLNELSRALGVGDLARQLEKEKNLPELRSDDENSAIQEEAQKLK